MTTPTDAQRTRACELACGLPDDLDVGMFLQVFRDRYGLSLAYLDRGDAANHLGYSEDGDPDAIPDDVFDQVTLTKAWAEAWWADDDAATYRLVNGLDAAGIPHGTADDEAVA